MKLSVHFSHMVTSSEGGRAGFALFHTRFTAFASKCALHVCKGEKRKQTKSGLTKPLFKTASFCCLNVDQGAKVQL